MTTPPTMIPHTIITVECVCEEYRERMIKTLASKVGFVNIRRGGSLGLTTAIVEALSRPPGTYVLRPDSTCEPEFEDLREKVIRAIRARREVRHVVAVLETDPDEALDVAFSHGKQLGVSLEELRAKERRLECLVADRVIRARIADRSVLGDVTAAMASVERQLAAV
jgi:hypothetical protein